MSVLGGLSVRTTQSKRSGRSSCKQELLPIDHSAAKACKCGFCGCSSGDPSPVPTDSADDCVPWYKYRKTESASGVAVRVPVGNHCSICRNLYRLLGYPHKHGPHGDYLKKVENKSVDHTAFLSARADFLKRQAKSEKVFRTLKKDRDQVRAAVTTLTTVQKTGTRFIGPEMTFVDIADWDPTSYGELDESKVVEETINGKSIRGIYVMTGKKGHYKVQSYDDRAQRQETEEHSRKDAKEMFADQALQNKVDAINAVFHENQRDREASAVAAKIMDTDSILAMIATGAIPSCGPSAAPGQAATAEAGEPETLDVLSSDSCSDDGGAAAARLAALKKKPNSKNAKPAAKPKANVKTVQAAEPTRPVAKPSDSSNPPPSKPRDSSSPALSKESRTKAAVPSEDRFDVLALDGRGMRLREALRKERHELAQKFEPLCGFGNDYNFTDKKQHATRNRSINSVLSAAVNQIKRIDGSANKAAFLQEQRDFEDLKGLLTAAVDFNNALHSQVSSPKALQEGYDTLLPHGLRVGSCFWFKMLETKLNETMTFRNLKDYVLVLAPDSYEAGGNYGVT